MIDGILNINKPEGITSAKCVYQIKKILKLKKAGHTGTLDPSASGILIICLNRATKIAQYFSNLDKVYLATMILGITTDTQDLKGKVVKINPVKREKVKPELIKKTFSRFQGENWQIPPMFSALRQKGIRMYTLARKGISINLKPRKINIYELEIIDIKYDHYPSITFQVKCSKGTYIRTLCHDIGESLGYGAYMSNLQRIKIGNYSIKQSIDLNLFLNLPIQQQYQAILSVDQALNHFKKLVLLDDQTLINRVGNGGNFSDQEIVYEPKYMVLLNETFRVYSSTGRFLALARSIKKMEQKIIFKIEKVFF